MTTRCSTPLEVPMPSAVWMPQYKHGVAPESSLWYLWSIQTRSERRNRRWHGRNRCTYAPPTGCANRSAKEYSPRECPPPQSESSPSSSGSAGTPQADPWSCWCQRDYSPRETHEQAEDRKSTRLNSSHV